MILSRVDFPPPDGPSSAVSWPDGIVSETLSSAVNARPLDAWQGDPAERLEPVRAEAARRLLLVVADLLEHGDDLPHHQRQRDEAGGHDHAGRGEDDLQPVRLERRAEPPEPTVV